MYGRDQLMQQPPQTFQQQLLLASTAGGKQAAGAIGVQSLRVASASPRHRPPRIGGGVPVPSPAFSTTMNPSLPSYAKRGWSPRSSGGGDGSGLTPRWERPLPERLATRLPQTASPVRRTQHGDDQLVVYDLPEVLAGGSSPLMLPAPLDSQLLLQHHSSDMASSGGSPTGLGSPLRHHAQVPHHAARPPPFPTTSQQPRLGSPSRRTAGRGSAPAEGPSYVHQFATPTAQTALQYSSSEARKIMDRLRDGVSSLCLSADSVLANLNDYDASHRNADEATRKAIMAELGTRRHRSGHDHDVVNSSSFSSDPLLGGEYHNTTAAEALETVLEALLAASGNPTEEALTAAVSAHRSHSTSAPTTGGSGGVKLRGVSLAAAADNHGASKPLMNHAAAPGDGASANLPVLAVSSAPPTAGNAAAAGGDSGVAVTPSGGAKRKPLQLTVEKALGEQGLGPTNTSEELFDIYDAQMHLQTVLQVTRYLTSEEGGLLPKATSASTARRGSLSNLTPAAVAAGEEERQQQLRFSMMMESVRTASKNAAMHLHNAVDVFRLQRLEIAALQEQQRRMAAASLFSSSGFGPSTPSALTKTAGGGGASAFHNHRHHSAPTASFTAGGSSSYVSASDAAADEFLVLVALDAAHLLDAELTPRQASAIRSLLHKFVHGVVERCDSGTIVRETVTPEGNRACNTSGTTATAACCILVSFTEAVEILCFERAVQYFSCYLPWRLTAACHGPLPTSKTHASPSTLLQQRLVEDVASASSITTSESPSSYSAGGGSGGDLKKKSTTQGAAAPSSVLLLPSLCLGTMIPLHGGTQSATSDGDALVAGGPLSREQRGDLMQVMAKIEDACRLVAIREIQSCLGFVRQEKASAPIKAQISRKGSLLHATAAGDDDATPATAVPEVHVSSVAATIASPRGGAGSPDPRSPHMPRVALVVPEDSSHRRRSDNMVVVDDAFPSMDVHTDELCLVEERIMLELTKKQLSSGDQPVWAVRGPLIRVAIHFGNSIEEARLDRYRPRNRLLDVVSSIQGRCRGGASVMTAEARRHLHRYLAAMDADVYEVDNTRDASLPAPSGSRLPSSTTSSLSLEHQKRLAQRLASADLCCPLHYELCWGNLVARYTYLVGIQQQQQRHDAQRQQMSGPNGVATTSLAAHHRGVPPEAVALRDFVTPIGYDVDWWLTISSARAAEAVSSATTATQTGDSGANGVAGGQRGGSANALKKSASPSGTQTASPMRRRNSGVRSSGGALQTEDSVAALGNTSGSDKDGGPSHDEGGSLLTSGVYTNTDQPQQQRRLSANENHNANRRRSSGAASAASSSTATGAALLSATVGTLSATAPAAPSSAKHRRKSSSMGTRGGAASLGTSQRLSHSIAIDQVREVGVQTRRDEENAPILGGGGATLRVSTKLLLECCRWMYEWIDGSMDEDSVVGELYALLGCHPGSGADEIVATLGAARGGLKPPPTPTATGMLSASGLSSQNTTYANPPQWSDLTSLAEELVGRFNAWPYGDDALASRAALALQFCTMRDTLREVNLYRRRRSSNATPNSAATAAAAAANARRASHSMALPNMPNMPPQPSVVKKPQPVGKAWQDAKNQVVANPTAALAGGQRPAIGAILGTNNNSVASPSPSRGTPPIAVIVDTPTSRVVTNQSPGSRDGLPSDTVAGGHFLPGPF